MTIRRLHRKNELKTPTDLASGAGGASTLSDQGRVYIGTSQVWNVGWLYFFPMINGAQYKRIIGSTSVRVTTAGSAGSVIHMGIYTAQGLANRHLPGHLIRSTTAPCDTTGTKLSIGGLVGPVPPGLIWIAWLHTSTTAINTDNNAIYDFIGGLTSGGILVSTRTVSGQTPPLPDDATGLTLETSSSFLNFMPVNGSNI